MSFATIHEDTEEAIEAWNKPVSIEDAVKSISSPDYDWDPVYVDESFPNFSLSSFDRLVLTIGSSSLKKVVSKFPDCIDWKLSWRDPLPRWVSDDGRVSPINVVQR